MKIKGKGFTSIHKLSLKTTEDNPLVVTQIIGHFRDGGFFWQRSSFEGAKSGYS